MNKPIITLLLLLLTSYGFSQAFVTTWKTDNPGVSADNQITIHTRINYTYNFQVDWGDGTSSENVSDDITHTYSTPGTYQISITGVFPAIMFGIINGEPRDELKLLEVNQWGDQPWQILGGAFDGCRNMDVLATDIPDLSGVWDTSFMFRGCESLVFNNSINDWDMSNVTFMADMFNNAPNFNQEIGNWDVSNVTDMSSLFVFSGFNQDIGNWDTSSVTTMNQMFFDSPFNQDISNWDVSNVADMSGMFRQTPFNQDIGSWDVAMVQDMSGMFDSCPFDQDLGSWDIGQVTTMSQMFRGAGLSQENYDATLIGWAGLPSLQNNVQLDAGDSVYCSGKSARAKLINDYNWTILDAGEVSCPFITTWKTDNPGITGDNQISIPTVPGEIYDFNVDWGDGTSDLNVTGDIVHTYPGAGTYQVTISGDFPRIYFNNYALGPIPEQGDENKIISIDQWGSIIWTSMDGAFAGCSNLDILATDVPDLSQVQSAIGMFRFCANLQGNDSMSFWDVSNINVFGAMFDGAVLFNQNIGNWDVSNATNLGNMFSGAVAFNQNLNSWDVSNVLHFDSMFAGATNFNQPLNAWNMNNAQTMFLMFSYASSFNQDIGNWNLTNVYDIRNIFNGAKSFNQDISNWKLESATDFSGMFAFAENFNQDLSSWDTSNVIEMAAMFSEATSFDQNLGGWDVSSVTDMTGMFSGSGLSTANYDATLIAWSALMNLQSNVVFDAGSSLFCDGTIARQFITDTYGWVINDEGQVPLCNEDNDADGIFDHLDACLNTSMGVTVDKRGCEVIPNTSIQVLVLTPSCTDSSDGAVQLTMTEPGYLLDVLIDGNGVNQQFNGISSDIGLKIADLPVGSYDLSVSIPDILFERDFTITVNALESVSGKQVSLDPKGKTVTYTVSGSRTYDVVINESIKTYQFDSTGPQSIEIANLDGYNEVIITGANDCQGSIIDRFYLGERFSVFPTLTQTSFTVFGQDTEVECTVFTLEGKVVRPTQKLRVADRNPDIDISALPAGMYLVKLNAAGEEQILKVIKQ